TESTIAPGQWLTLEVIAQGNHIVVKVDGQVAADYLDEARRFSRGRIVVGSGLQSVAAYRKIEIRELEPAPDENVTGSPGLVVIRGFPRYIWGVALSPEAKHAVIACADSTVRVCDAATGHEIRKLFAGTHESAHAAYSPDGKLIASCALVGTVFLW